MKPNIPVTDKKRIVIIGAGFAGLEIAQRLSKKDFQVVLIDRNNYHQFQPLFYQVAMAGLEPSSISFPLRKIFQSCKNVHIRVTDVHRILPDGKTIETGLGAITFDELVIATGADTNYYGMKEIEERAIPMKSVGEALALRNRILQNFEDAVSAETALEREALMNVVVVGGGPTGVELSGTLAEMKRFILPKDYPDLNFDAMHIYLVEGGGEVLDAMSDEASAKAREYLDQLGVTVVANQQVNGFDGQRVTTKDGLKLPTKNLVWAAGIRACPIGGFSEEKLGRGGRLKVNAFNQVEGYETVYALGDVAIMSGDEKYPNGHPQLAQAAIQQAKQLAKNIIRKQKGEAYEPFQYRDLGTMATVGRNLAVVDLTFWKFQGFFAWLVWMFVHLMSIVGVKNRLMVFINWVWNYITYDQSLRLIIKPKPLPAGISETENQVDLEKVQ
ncbi:NAD(P)/FAD-dependent oxidoreductase [Persicitalea jodogahamensis]|uniref:NADH:ubiquinone reductase (non-electrogenic) n=1 Tax=Persicitalea jodogahamensis TaxID=402147 RepID=A0A8J3D4Q3_9BACT|nr:NAD(P)/FAD-dependent oxidoreductase [Persicitalea jodogahamensis]GHB59436.1 NADH dehydrogenase [Persicitalea jodogahamensis]